MLGRLALCLALGLSLIGVAAAQEPWPATRTPDEDAPAAAASAAPSSPASVAVVSVAPRAESTAATPGDAATAPPLFLADLDGAARYALLLVVLLLAYTVPALLYPTLLSATTLSPGRGAAVSLAAGALLIAGPGALAVLARARFLAGAPVPWYRQTTNFPVAAGCVGGLLLLAGLAWRTRSTRGDA